MREIREELRVASKLREIYGKKHKRRSLNGWYHFRGYRFGFDCGYANSFGNSNLVHDGGVSSSDRQASFRYGFLSGELGRSPGGAVIVCTALGYHASPVVGSQGAS
jgi:hypothetical protein